MSDGDEHPVNLVVDNSADEDDNDSALGRLSTTSIGSSILSFPEENGRTYHAYKAGRYPWPNDERMRIPKRSLPPNLKFEVDDLESDWTFSRPFTYIHSRMMLGSFSNWPKFINQCFANLEPGGYIELTELTFAPVFPSLSSPSTASSAPSSLLQWTAHLLSTSALLSRPMCPPFCFESLLESTGFVSIKSHHFSWPINGWPTDPKEKELGEWCLANFDRGLSGLSMALFTRAEGGLGWSRESTELFLVGVRKEIRDKRRKGFWEGKVLYAQKPWV
ncbi:hypothetical protein B7494_g1143 [Chlorociboria aeruginascens]|nr:hypothetical protein B7494_g1143 [Chlorociboria aeruginascens]